jgi:hypothetical protein
MFVIGIDPHKGSHTAAVLDDTEVLVGELRVNADRWQRDRLLRFAAPFEPRTWAVEAASGLGALLAQQLVAAGECVVDVPPRLSAGRSFKGATRTPGWEAVTSSVLASAHQNGHYALMAEPGCRRIHHVALVVNDPDAALAFYRDVLGLSVVDRPDGANNPGSYFNLITGRYTSSSLRTRR